MLLQRPIVMENSASLMFETRIHGFNTYYQRRTRLTGLYCTTVLLRTVVETTWVFGSMLLALLHHHRVTKILSVMDGDAFYMEYDSMNQGIMGNWSYRNGLWSCILTKRPELYQKQILLAFWFLILLS
jgi:hypothetical protein